MVLRFKHDVTLGGVNYAAGTKDKVPITDDAWKAVNEGHADCDPPPGTTVGDWTQPEPPDWVTGGPSTVVPLPGTSSAPPAPKAGKTGHEKVPVPEPTEKPSEPPPPPLRRR